MLKPVLRALVLATAVTAIFSSSALAGQTRPQIATVGPSLLLGGPSAVALDSADVHLFVGGYDTNAFRNRVFKFDPATESLDPSFGSGGQIDGSSTAPGSFSYPHSVATDPADGSIYVGDWYAGLVYKFDSTGELIESFGDNPPPDGSLRGIDTEAGTIGPGGVAVDPSNGDLYVADGNNSVVAVYDSEGIFKHQFDLAPSGLFGPSGIALDSTGNVYVAGSGQVQKFDTAGNPVPVDGVPGDSNVLDTGGAVAVAVDQADGSVYVDEGNGIVEYDGAGQRIGAFGAGILTGSQGLAVPSGAAKVYVSDANDSLIHVFGTPEPSSALSVEIQGSGSVSCDTGSGPGGCLPYYPQGTTVTLEATSEAHFAFEGWGGVCTGTGPCVISNIAADTTVSAGFEQLHRTVSVALSGSGTGLVSATSGPISECASGGGGVCSGIYDDGATVVLKATRAGHSAFNGWTGACSSVSGLECSISELAADSSVTAEFAALGPEDVTYTTEPDIQTPAGTFGGSRDIAIEPTTGNLLVPSGRVEPGGNGIVAKLSPDGTLLNEWQQVEDAQILGVALNPVNGQIYGLTEAFHEHLIYEITPYDENGNPQGFTIDAPINPLGIRAYPMRIDSRGLLYFPNRVDAVVRIDTASGLKDLELTCQDCPGRSSFHPNSVAIGPDDSVYVGDDGIPGAEPAVPARVIRFNPDGSFDSVFTEFPAANEGGFDGMSLATDPSTGDVFVGSGVGPTFHIVGYDAAGKEFADFGMGDATAYNGGITGYTQIAVSSLTGVVYETDILSSGLSVLHRYSPDAQLMATTEPATNLRSTSATLEGVINPNGAATIDCRFEYGPTASYGSSVPCASAPGVTSIRTGVSAPLTGLASESTIHYRVVVQTAGGSSSGHDMTVTTTAPPAPGVTTGQASGVSQTGGHVSGTVDTGEVATTCEFEYGLTTAYGSAAPCQPQPGAADQPMDVGADLSGLVAGTTYHYRLVASSEGGTTPGEDGTFTTPADTCQTRPALCPPGAQPAPGPSLTPGPAPLPGPVKCKKGYVKRRVLGKTKCIKPKRHRRRHHPSAKLETERS